MNRLLLIGIFLTLSSLCVSAQWLPTANLTVFSDEGEPFTLVLNGEKYNTSPQTNIRVEELPNPYYSCKIIFENKAIPQISKNIQLTDANAIPQDVTYRIKKSGAKYVLRFYSMIPAEQNMMRPSNVPVYHFGSPGVLIGGPGYNGAQVPPPNNNGQNGVNVNVNLGGIGINMNGNITTDNRQMNSGNTGSMNSNGGNNSQGNYPPPPPPSSNTRCNAPMNSGDFNAALQTIAKVSFEDTRLETAKTILSTNCMSTSQINQLLQKFSFASNKLELAKFAYDYCIDPRNYFKVVNTLTFDSDKQDLNSYLQSRQ